MPQVLKEEVRESLVAAASQIFMERGFSGARLTDIADTAGVSTGLVYSYFKNKEELFQAVIAPLPPDFEAIAQAEEALETGSPLEKYQTAAAEYIENILKYHREFVILMDKSHGTPYADTKSRMVQSVQAHIERELTRNKKKSYPKVLPHILASNFVSGLLEVARHYENITQAQELLSLIISCYYEGVNSL
ncbi:TetR/AcrR family transcriptional regulator [Mobiluncus mulieris]|uniref:TetR/AcrR family transcriptional regulator n=1 Tax=Mobiluncus mulieris TaxID=2052 RepID=A0A2J9KRQ6_9ACTO|nr:TetR/AcrR family transcriptional regulator [Mobiluncus mulieris]EEJ54222.1 transcriptional regulator, TetR family [Mobiluncus mulieris ATCC 35243]MCU9975230.1 TetR/AcrR family transcriptional regulator [Mobiluncus mulieris]MCV0001465.1 TetR/AcrR family transcriptional regulator [Mobiluncus mulieris]NMW60676.1 TetR/AcrR family transcriptional regulator [Mobiluncus mulieris]NMW65263.1 TetR/AcrR family transcriptional regulator [Mobiluncus mulieris]